MINNVIYINRQGLSHSQCEDSAFIDDDNAVYVVCDGVSNSAYGGEGAKELSENIGKLFSEQKVKNFISIGSVEDVRKFMTCVIKDFSESTANKLGCNVNDIASTLIVVSVFKDIITIIHAGDGAVFAAPETVQDEVPMIVSYPDNDSKQRVYPAASPRQLERMRVLRLHQGDIKCLVFGTDGFTDKYLRPATKGFDGYSLNNVFKIQNKEELNSLIENNHLKRPAITDDITAVIIKFNNSIDYTKKAVVEPVESQDTVKINIKTPDDTPVDEENNRVDTDSETEKRDSSRKVSKAILLSISVLVICCVIAVGVLGKSLQTVNKNANEQISNMSEEISHLKSRLEKLETTTVKVEEESNTYESTTISDSEKETTSQTQNSLDDDMKPNEDSNNYVIY